jgi:glucan 1,3-beta-glucosidase
MGRGADPSPPAGNSIILENVDFNNVVTAVQGPGASTVLSGNVGHVAAWGQGNSYSTSGSTGVFQGSITPNNRPSSLTSGTDFYEKSKPQYEQVTEAGFVSVKDEGAAGDGKTDDSDALIAIFADAAISGKIVYIDAGDYLVSKTIYVPSGVKIFGEAASLAYFLDKRGYLTCN